MGRTVAIGIQNFAEIREKNCFYIDKTAFIKEWWESEDKVTLITRPRRFGKTLNMSMLEKFFSLKYGNRKDLFEGLSIWQEEEYRRLQGSYPVIFLSFAEVKENRYQGAKEMIRQILMENFRGFWTLTQEDSLPPGERDFLLRGAEGRLEERELTRSLHRLSEILYRVYGQKVIILLDEYDTPMQEAWLGGFWEEMAGFMGSLFNSTFKTNPYL